MLIIKQISYWVGLSGLKAVRRKKLSTFLCWLRNVHFSMLQELVLDDAYSL